MQKSFSTIKKELTALILGRTSSQRVASLGVVFLGLIVLSLLFGYDQSAEQYAIGLYYTLVVSVLLGLSEDVRGHLYTYMQKNVTNPIYIRGSNRVLLAKNNIDVGKTKTKLSGFIDRFVLTMSDLWSWLQMPYTYGSQEKSVLISPKDKRVYIYGGVGMVLLSTVVMSKTLRLQVIQLGIPDMFADMFVSMSVFSFHILGTLVWAAFWGVSLYLLLPSNTAGFSRSKVSLEI